MFHQQFDIFGDMVEKMDFKMMRKNLFDQVALAQPGRRNQYDLFEEKFEDELSFNQKKGCEQGNRILFYKSNTIPDPVLQQMPYRFYRYRKQQQEKKNSVKYPEPFRMLTHQPLFNASLIVLYKRFKRKTKGDSLEK